MNSKKIKLKIIIAVLTCCSSITFSFAQTTPYQMVERMGRGMNLGNVLSAPVEGNWSPAVTEQYFQDVADAGFTCVRIPIRFDTNTDLIAPYTVASTYLDRVEVVTDWALSKGLVAIIDIHGDHWFWESYSDGDPATPTQETYDRFLSIWTHISDRFKNKSENLLFEIMNEPYFDMSKAEVDAVNTDIIPIIRANNPTRNIIITGGGNNSFNAPLQIDPAIISSDNYLIATFHYYRPFSFTSSAKENHTDNDWGSASDKQNIDNDFDVVKTWSDNNNIPILLGEFGADNEGGLDYETSNYGSFGGPDAASRLEYHRYITESAFNRGFAFTAWCAGPSSNKSINLRADNTTNAIAGTWVEDIKNALLTAGCWPEGVALNTGFECGISTNWSLSVQGASAAATYTDATTNARSGAAAAQVEVTVADAYNKVVLANTEFAGDLTSKKLTITCYGKALGSSQTFKLRTKSTVSGSNSFKSSGVLNLSNAAYQKFSYSYDILPNTTAITVQVICGENAGIYYFDDFAITIESVENTWTGATSTDWNNASNWSMNSIPTSSNDVTVASVATLPNISSSAEVNDLTLHDNLTVSSGYLKVNGHLNGINGAIQVSSGASLVTMSTVTGVNHTFERNTTFDQVTGKYSIIGTPVIDASTSLLGSLVYAYDENIPYGNGDQERFDKITSPEIMSIGDAYFSAYTGTVIFTGQPNTGNIDVPLVYNNGIDGMTNAGFNLVSNPYPAAINFSSFVASNPDISGTIYLWDDQGSDNSQRTNNDYITVNSVGQVGGSVNRAADWNSHITSSQGFFVKANNAGTLHFTDAMKVNDNNQDNAFFRISNIKPKTIRLSLESETGTSEILFGILDKATIGIDHLYDAPKIVLKNQVQFYSWIEGMPFAIQGLPYESRMEIGLGANFPEQNQYKIKLIANDFIDKNIVLIDTKLNTQINLSEGESYPFNNDIESNSTRFKLSISSKILAIDDLDISDDFRLFYQNRFLQIHLLGEESVDNVVIYTINGKVVLNEKVLSLKSNKWDALFLHQGFFIIQVQSNGHLLTKKFIVK